MSDTRHGLVTSPRSRAQILVDSGQLPHWQAVELEGGKFFPATEGNLRIPSRLTTSQTALHLPTDSSQAVATPINAPSSTSLAPIGQGTLSVAASSSIFAGIIRPPT